MIPKINGLGRSFAGVAAYCLHDAPEPDDRSPESSERVAWTDTRNLPTIRAERAARLMAATVKVAPGPQAAGGVRGGAEAGEAGPALLAQLGEEGDAGSAGDEPGRSGAGRTWSKAGARISTGTTRASGLRWARHTPTAPGRSSGR